MTETITLPDGQLAESPHIPRPQSDGAALRAIGEATSHLTILNLPQLSIMDMPGRQRDIQDCVDKILAKVDPAAAAG
jgi:hypothetical protein